MRKRRFDWLGSLSVWNIQQTQDERLRKHERKHCSKDDVFSFFLLFFSSMTLHKDLIEVPMKKARIDTLVVWCDDEKVDQKVQ